MNKSGMRPMNSVWNSVWNTLVMSDHCGCSNSYLIINDVCSNLVACVNMSKNRLFALNTKHDMLNWMKAIVKDEYETCVRTQS